MEGDASALSECGRFHLLASDRSFLGWTGAFLGLVRTALSASAQNLNSDSTFIFTKIMIVILLFVLETRYTALSLTKHLRLYSLIANIYWAFSHVPGTVQNT